MSMSDETHLPLSLEKRREKVPNFEASEALGPIVYV